MSTIQNIVEYYDELFPVTTVQKKFYDSLVKEYPNPVKFLRIECGTGMFESILAREGYDVTGIESSEELLRSANMRRRSQLMSIHFFQMNYLDMPRFLGKSFYNIISILDDRILFIHDRTLMRKFFHDVKNLLTESGTFIVTLPNFDIMQALPMQKLPTRVSVRAALYTEMWEREDGKHYIKQNLETGNGRMIPILDDAPIYALKSNEVKEFASEAGFKEIRLYSNFEGAPFTGKEDSIVVTLK